MRPMVAILLLANLAVLGCVYAYAWREPSFESVRALTDTQIEKNRCDERESGTYRIGWAEDFDSAFALARKSGRPLFVLHADGDICTGRL